MLTRGKEAFVHSGWPSLFSREPNIALPAADSKLTKHRLSAFEVFPLVRVELERGSPFALGGVSQVGCGADDLLLLFPFWISSFL